MRVQRDALALAPALPDGITRLAFRVQWHGTRLLVEADGDEVRCTVHGPSGAGVPLRLYGEDLEVTIPDPVIRPLQHRESLLRRPPQPSGREPKA